MSFCPAALGNGGPTTKPQWRTVACASFAEVYRLTRRGQIAVLVVPADVDPGELSALRTTFPPRYGVLVGPLRRDRGCCCRGGLEGRRLHRLPRGSGPRVAGHGRAGLPHASGHAALAPRAPPRRGQGRQPTSREREVLKLLVAGAPNKAIGQAWAISESSVPSTSRGSCGRWGPRTVPRPPPRLCAKGSCSSP